MRFQTPSGKEGVASGGQGEGPISRETRETIARLRNCVVALAREKVLLFDTTVQYTYDASLKYEVCLSTLSCDQFKNVMYYISLAQNYLLNIERQNFGILYLHAAI